MTITIFIRLIVMKKRKGVRRIYFNIPFPHRSLFSPCFSHPFLPQTKSTNRIMSFRFAQLSVTLKPVNPEISFYRAFSIAKGS